MSITFRKLDVSEHEITRALWEEIFSLDTKAFLDYYYRVKTKKNEIYAAFDQEKLCAMLQLNPYKMQFGDREVPGNYIIAVATDPKYRKRGIMASLLSMAMREMQERKEPFTFLMPAAEAIYYPFDFRYMYRQNQGKVCGRESKDTVWVKEAASDDCSTIAEFISEELQKNHKVYAVRDTDYYETLLQEQQSENGGILMTLRGETLSGCLLYAKDEGIEIREPVFKAEYADDFLHAVFKLTGSGQEEVQCLAYGSEQKPMIMARILDLKTFWNSIKVREDLDLCIRITDDCLPDNQGVYRLFGKAGEAVAAEQRGDQEHTETVSTAALVSFLFGYKNWKEIIEEEDLSLSGGTLLELEKMVPVAPVFLNEIV